MGVCGVSKQNKEITMQKDGHIDQKSSYFNRVQGRDPKTKNNLRNLLEKQPLIQNHIEEQKKIIKLQDNSERNTSNSYSTNIKMVIIYKKAPFDKNLDLLQSDLYCRRLDKQLGKIIED